MSIDLSKLLGAESAARQLLVWQVFGQLLSAGLAPELEFVTRAVNKKLPSTPLAPAELADMVVRNIVSLQDGTSYARESGIADADFARMVHNAGEPPSPEQMLAAVRRGAAPMEGTGPDQVSFQQAVAESRIYTKYTKVLQALADIPLAPSEAVDAVVEGQITHDQGAHEAFLSGVNADRFQIMVNTRGNPPSPLEALELYHRGLIPLEGTGPDALTVQQAVFEGATKDKWWPLLSHLGDYIPPPRTVTAMIREGSLTDEQGAALFKMSGLPPDLIDAYLQSAHSQKLAARKDLALSQVEQLYQDQLISRDEALQMGEPLGYTAQEMNFVLDLVDVKRAVQAVNQAVSRLHTLYVSGRVDKQTAVNEFGALGLPSGQRDQLLATWDIERQSNVKTLTADQVASALFYKIIGPDEAMAELEGMGYSARDAFILLSVRLHGPITTSQTVPGAPTSGG